MPPKRGKPQADPLEQVPAFQRQPPPMRTLAETAEGTVLAKTRPADDPARERTVNQLETQFSGELALTAGKGKGAPSTPAACLDWHSTGDPPRVLGQKF